MSVDQASQPGTPPVAGGSPAGVATRFLAGAAVLVLIGLLSLSDVTLVLAFGFLVSLVVIPMSRLFVVVYSGAVLGLSVLMSDVPINLGPFKLYGADSLILLLGYAVAYFLHRLGHGQFQAPKGERWLTALLVAWCIYGFLLLVYSFLAHSYPYDKIFGDYRRMYFYALAFVVPLWIPLQERHLAKAKYAVLVGGVLLALIGMWRIVAQAPIRVDENLATGYTGQRMLAVSEFSICALVLAYTTCVLRLRARYLYKLIALAIAGVVAALMLLSGFRLAIVFVAFAPVLAIVLITWARRDSFLVLARTGALAGLAAIPFVIVAGFLFQEQFNRMVADMEVRTMDAQVTGDYRQWTWTEAMSEFRASPVIGAGLGHELFFLNRTRAGFFEYRRASAHSTLISVLYQTGIIGIALFAVFHGGFILYFLTRLRRLPLKYHAIACGLFTGYVCLMLASFSQPLRVAGYVAIALVMGWVCRFMRECDAPPVQA